jgi:hypothetical protein
MRTLSTCRGRGAPDSVISSLAAWRHAGILLISLTRAVSPVLEAGSATRRDDRPQQAGCLHYP